MERATGIEPSTVSVVIGRMVRTRRVFRRARWSFRLGRASVDGQLMAQSSGLPGRNSGPRGPALKPRMRA